MTTTATPYLLYTLGLDLGGDAVRLYGGVVVRGDEVRFVLSGDMPFDAHLLPPGTATTEIRDPLGLTGVTLTGLTVDGRVYERPGGGTGADLAVRGTALFPSLPRFRLDGALVLDDGAPRLAMVALTAEPPLTLTELLGSVAGGYMAWAATVTDQFAFRSGVLYWLRAPAGSPPGWTWPYAPVAGGPAVAFQPGYHAQGTFRMFDSFDFQVALGMQDGESTLVTTSPDRIDILPGLFSLDAPYLEFASRRAERHLRVRTTVTILGTPLAEVAADYLPARDAFHGDVHADLGTVHLPAGVGDQPVRLDVSFAWDRQGGFRIEAIGGLPSVTLPDLAQKVSDLLNAAGGCEKVVKEWADGLVSTRFRPSLAQGKSPTTADGKLVVPLALTYTLDVAGFPPRDTVVEFRAVVDLPSSLGDLPLALCRTLLDSAERILGDVLSDPRSYEVIAFEVARRGAAQGFARMICRALQQGLGDLAKSLAAEGAAATAETIAAAAELAAWLIAAALFGVHEVLSFFQAIWKEIEKLFGGGDDDKEAARDRIRAIQRDVDRAVQAIRARVGEVGDRIAAAALTTALDGASRVVCAVRWRATEAERQDYGRLLTCHLVYMDGVADGHTAGAPLLDVADATFPDARALAEVGGAGVYRMNAEVRTSLRGYTFMSDDARAQITSAQATLRGFKDSVADGLVSYLDGVLAEFDGYNRDGIRSPWVLATTDEPTGLVLGRSRLGVNSRLAA
ncbi:MAG: hypothetical protein AMXMBFR53_29060 [Gemmatimonadota bacterium]